MNRKPKLAALAATIAWVQLLASPAALAAEGQQQSYNDAAKASDDASKSNTSSAVVYGAAAAVCAYSCAMSWSMGSQEGFCTEASLGAGVADALITQNLAGAMMSLGSFAMMSNMGKQGVNDVARVKIGNLGAKKGVNGAENDGVSMSCVSTVMNGGQAIMKGMAASDAKDTAAKNRQYAKDVAPKADNTPYTPNGTAGGTASGQAGSTSSGSSGGATTTAGLESTGSGACARTGGDFAASVSCAAASGMQIPGGVMDPRFGAALKNATGLDPNEFAKKVERDGASKAIGDAIASSFGGGSEVTARSGQIMAALERSVGYSEPGSVYAGGGGGKPAGGAPDDEFGKMMAGIMDQFGPKKPGEDKPKGVSELAFGKQGGDRYPASVAEDRRVSLFDRVTARYSRVTLRVLTQAQAPTLPPIH